MQTTRAGRFAGYPTGPRKWPKCQAHSCKPKAVVDAFIGMGQGFLIALTPQNLYYCFIGCLFGTVVGVLPGVGPLAGISLLLPATFGMEPVSALIMLAGIYYGAMYGGSTTSILMNIPGEAASVVTCLDGYQMARKGRAGAALFISGWGSFIGGNLSVLGIALLAPALAGFAVKFGPAEMFAVMALAMMLVGYVGSGSVLKTMCMVVLGLFLGTIGMDTMTGYLRMTYGVKELADGIGFIPVAMGLFGISEILSSTQDNAGPGNIQAEASGAAPESGRTEAFIGSYRPRLRPGFFYRSSSRGGSHHCGFRQLCPGKETGAPSRGVRHRSD